MPGIVPWWFRVSPIFKGCFKGLWQTPIMVHSCMYLSNPYGPMIITTSDGQLYAILIRPVAVCCIFSFDWTTEKLFPCWLISFEGLHEGLAKKVPKVTENSWNEDSQFGRQTLKKTHNKKNTKTAFKKMQKPIFPRASRAKWCKTYVFFQIVGGYRIAPIRALVRWVGFGLKGQWSEDGGLRNQEQEY